MLSDRTYHQMGPLLCRNGPWRDRYAWLGQLNGGWGHVQSDDGLAENA